MQHLARWCHTVVQQKLSQVFFFFPFTSMAFLHFFFFHWVTLCEQLCCADTVEIKLKINKQQCRCALEDRVESLLLFSLSQWGNLLVMSITSDEQKLMSEVRSLNLSQVMILRISPSWKFPSFTGSVELNFWRHATPLAWLTADRGPSLQSSLPGLHTS